MANFTGTAGNDSLIGTTLDDTFDITLGGTDSVLGGQGDDLILAGATLDTLDSINGGAGYDKLDITGNYSAGVTFNANTLRNVEEIHFGGGFDYKIKTHDKTVAAGTVLKLDAYNMTAGSSLHFDGSAETDGSFLFYDGMSNDTFIGGAQSDSISLAYGGVDKIYGNGGGDVITAYGSFTNEDVIDGGEGNDVLYLSGDYNLAIQASAMISIETLGLAGNHNYALSLAGDALVAGQELYVTAEGLEGAGKATFNGSAITQGTFTFKDGINDDTFIGGAGNDVFNGAGGGQDIFQGGLGDDTFFMAGNLDAGDQIFGGQGNDVVYLSGDYSAGITFDTFTLSGIETLATYDGYSYAITTDDATVGPGKTFMVEAGYLSKPYKINFDGSAETDGNFKFYGGAGNDLFRGGAGDDYFDASGGGNDRFHGGAGNDAVSFFGSYTTNDFADGGEGYDSVHLYGDFGAGLVLGANQFRNIESISLGSGYSYKVKTLDSLVGAGQTLGFDTYFAAATESFTFDGSAETDGHFALTGGRGNDHLTGGANADDFFLNRGGADTMIGGAGDDVFHVSSGLTVSDKLNGGSGFDTVEFSQDVGSFTFGATTFLNMEQFNMYAGRSYSLTTHDATVAAGRSLTFDGWFLAADESLTVNGQAETNGSFVMIGGAGADSLTGGAMADTLRGNDGNDTLKGNGGDDTLTGGLGRDQLFGGAGNDTFVFTAIAETVMGANSDTIRDWNAGDIIDLSAIDANETMAGNQAFTFIGTDAFSAAGQIRVFSNATTTFVRGDVDGDGVVDFQIQITGVHTIGADSFLL